MNITLTNAGRRFNKEWIFRNVNETFIGGKRYAIVGGNGSGKSTFLQMISGFLIPSEGTITFEKEGNKIEPDSIFRSIAICSPFQEIYDDFTAAEMFDFHSQLKPMRLIDTRKFIDLLELQNIKNKALRNYSSGMKQRVKLALAILSDTPILLLDEPCSNLDRKAIEWYKNLLREHADHRLVFVSSNNNEDEMFLCDEIMDVERYK